MTYNHYTTDYKVQYPSHRVLIYLDKGQLQQLRPNPQSPEAQPQCLFEGCPAADAG